MQDTVSSFKDMSDMPDRDVLPAAASSSWFTRVVFSRVPQVTRLERDPSTGTAIQEVSFWLNFQHALNHIREERESAHVHLTLDVLKHARRFHATVRYAMTGALVVVVPVGCAKTQRKSKTKETSLKKRKAERARKYKAVLSRRRERQIEKSSRVHCTKPVAESSSRDIARTPCRRLCAWKYRAVDCAGFRTVSRLFLPFSSSSSSSFSPSSSPTLQL